MPKCTARTFPIGLCSAIGPLRFISDDAQAKRGVLDLHRALNRGAVCDWEAFSEVHWNGPTSCSRSEALPRNCCGSAHPSPDSGQVLDHTMERLGASFEDQPLMLTERAIHSKDSRTASRLISYPC